MFRIRRSTLWILLLIILIGGGSFFLDRTTHSLDEGVSSGVNEIVIGDQGDHRFSTKVVHEPATQAASPSAWVSLEESMRMDDEGLVVEQCPEGHQVLHLGSRFHHVATASHSEAGGRRIQCFNHYPALEAMLRGDVVAIPEYPEEKNEVVYR